MSHSMCTLSTGDLTTSHLDAVFAATIAVVVTFLAGYSWFAAQTNNAVLQSRRWAFMLLKATLATLAVDSCLRWVGLAVQVTCNETVDAVFHGMSSVLEYITLPCSQAILFLLAHDLHTVVGKKLNSSIAYSFAAFIALGGLAGGVTGVYGIFIGDYHNYYQGAFVFTLFSSFTTLLLSGLVLIPVMGKVNLRTRRTRDLIPPSTDSEFQSVVWTTKSVGLLLGGFSTLTIVATTIMMIQNSASHSVNGMLIQLLAVLSCFLSIGIARSVPLLDPSRKFGDLESPPPSYVEKMAIDFKDPAPMFSNSNSSRPSPPPNTHNAPRPLSTTLPRGYLNNPASFSNTSASPSPQLSPGGQHRPSSPTSPTRDPNNPANVKAIRRTSSITSQTPRLATPPPPIAAAASRRRSALEGPQLERRTSTLGSAFAATSSNAPRAPGHLRDGEVQMMTVEEEEAARRMERRKSLALNMTPYITAA